MTRYQVGLLRKSFAALLPVAEAAAALFYARLFELDPSLRSSVSGDLREQGRRLMHMLTVVVRGLDTPETLQPALRSLGRQVGYGVTHAHDASAELAMLWTLEQALGSEFTPEVREAWRAAHTWLIATLQTARETSFAPQLRAA
jgi:hemoglobin-like flavoprotein